MSRDYKNSRIVGVIGAAIFFLAVSFHFAFADTYSRIPTGNVSSDNYTVNATFDDIENICFAMPWDPPAVQYAITLYRSSDGANYQTLPLRGHWQDVNNLTYTHTFEGIDTRNISYVSIDCDFGNGNISYAGVALEQGLSGSVIFTITEYITPTPTTIDNIWRSPNGFWGTTTPTAMIGTMAASVQETNANIWPLFKIMGVLIGFMIAGYLVYFIKLELEPRKVAATPGKTEEFIEHSTADLKFKREYGAEPIKRKRGRPRKDV